MKAVKFIVMLLMVIGSLNWGLVGFFEYDLVADIFGGMYSGAARVVYSLVGIAGLIGIRSLVKCCCGCNCGPSCGCGSSGCGSKRRD